MLIFLKRKTSIISIIIGIISISGSIGWIFFPQSWKLFLTGTTLKGVVYCSVFIFLSLIGLVFGFLSLKIRRNGNIAKIGIFLCFIGVFFLIFLLSLFTGFIQTAR